jgi:SAM-dependent methyltransferase
MNMRHPISPAGIAASTCQHSADADASSGSVLLSVSAQLSRALAALPANSRILDAGAWFRPLPVATHAVDLLPYETRGGRLRLTPLHGERFSKKTWHQINFLEPSLRLPFPDRSFDFCVCSQTIEDLSDPEPLLRELRRVSRAGAIECPSRLAEQTVGVRDRVVGEQGHPHHHWIVDSGDCRLELASKHESLVGPRQAHAVPLAFYERLVAANPEIASATLLWTGDFDWRILSSREARVYAQDFVTRLSIPPGARLRDAVVRRLRGWKRIFRAPHSRPPEVWWHEMLVLSRPYSTIPL